MKSKHKINGSALVFLLLMFMGIALAETCGFGPVASRIDDGSEEPETSLSHFQEAEIRGSFFPMAKALHAFKDEFILTGWMSTEGANPAVFSISTLGTIQWKNECLVDGNESDVILSIFPDESGTYTALMKRNDFMHENMKTGTYINTILDGEVVHSIEISRHLTGMVPTEDGYFGSYMIPESGPTDSTVFVQLDKNGNVVKEKDMEQQIHIKEILPVHDGYIMYGTSDYYDLETVGDQVIKLNDSLDIVWRYETGLYVDFSDAVCISADEVVLVGTNYYKEVYTGTISKYNADGLVWNVEYEYPDNRDGSMYSIVEVSDGYLISCKLYGQRGGLRLVQIDGNGNIVKEWDQETGVLYAVLGSSLHNDGEQIFLLVTGKEEAEKTPAERENITKIMLVDW